MNEYSRIQNTKDRAALLAQLVNADARILAASIASAAPGAEGIGEDEKRFEQSRAELWKLIGPAEESEGRDERN